MPVFLSTSILPSPSSNLTWSDDTNSVRFGNGYQQDSVTGINFQYEEWDLVYENLTLSDRNTVKGVVLAASTWDYIVWTNPDGETKTYKRPKGSSYQESTNGNRYTLKFKLRQAFRPGGLTDLVATDTSWDIAWDITWA